MKRVLLVAMAIGVLAGQASADMTTFTLNKSQAMSLGQLSVTAIGTLLAVTDSGVGIDPADQEFIFDKFFRVGKPNLHSSGEFSFMGGGPGLGLSIARAVIEAHGGRIRVESEGYDQERCPGSAFHVVLPLEAISPIAAPTAAKEKVLPFTVMPEGF